MLHVIKASAGNGKSSLRIVQGTMHLSNDESYEVLVTGRELECTQTEKA